MSADQQNRRLYGRRMGRPLNKTRQDVIDTLLPALEIPEECLTEKGNLDTASLFDSPRARMVLEIGFGNGEHVADMMRARPGDGFIACEPFINGMAAFLKEIKDEKHDHVRVWMEDAIIVADSLSDNSLDEIYVLNPDPWPKKRHYKRRIISQDNLDKFARILKPGGLLTMTTDVDDLSEWMVTQASRHPAFEWTAESASDWQTPPKGWLPTRYETKGIAAGRKQTYLLFRRL